MAKVVSKNLEVVDKTDLKIFSENFYDTLSSIEFGGLWEISFSKKTIAMKDPWTSITVKGKFKNNSKRDGLKYIKGKVKSIRFEKVYNSENCDETICVSNNNFYGTKLFGVGMKDWKKKASLLVTGLSKKANFTDLFEYDDPEESQSIFDFSDRDDLICNLRSKGRNKNSVLYDYIINQKGYDSIYSDKQSEEKYQQLVGMLDGRTNFYVDDRTQKIWSYGKRNNYILSMGSDGRFASSSILNIEGFGKKDKIIVPKELKGSYVISDDGKYFHKDVGFLPVWDGTLRVSNECGPNSIIRPNQIKYV